MSSKIRIWIISLGIIAISFHNLQLWVVDLISFVFLAWGLVTLIITLIQKRKKLTLGSRWVYIPLLIISLSIVMSGVMKESGYSIVWMIALVCYFFGVYLIGRLYGAELFKPFMVAIILVAFSVILYSLVLNYGIRNGGWSGPSSYNTATGVLVFGAFVCMINRQWILVTIAAIGLFFTGSKEGLVCLAVLLVTILVRRDISIKLLVPVCLFILIAILGFWPFNYTRLLYAHTIDTVSMVTTGHHSTIIPQDNLEEPGDFGNMANYLTHGREVYTHFQIKPFGTGYVLLPQNPIDRTNHNIPFVIIQQVGPVAGLAWAFLMVYLLWKTKWRYALIAVLALGLFDNFMWCQMGGWWWALMGVSSSSQIKQDLIFRGVYFRS